MDATSVGRSRKVYSSDDAAANVLAELERSKYTMRIILLLYRHRELTLYRILRKIPASPPTLIRSLRLLEMYGFVTSKHENEGLRRHYFTLTELGLRIAVQPPIVWGEGAVEP